MDDTTSHARGTFARIQKLPVRIREFSSTHRRMVMSAFGIIIVVAGVWISMSAPRNFPAPTIFSIPRGATLTRISNDLAEARIVRSAAVFQAFAIFFAGDRSITAGDFTFESNMPVYTIAWRITHAQFGIARKRVTIPEGSTVKDISAILEKQLINFDGASFIAKASESEGYLFPDTYFFFSNALPEEVLKVCTDTFTTKIAPFHSQIENSKRSFADIITMASIIEREANKPDDRRIVAGILWKRLDAGMRLQVDAPFFYLRQESAEQEVTVDDLKTDSPYNTYLYKGLPPAPIGNPGLDSIIAALEPTASSYWYYLYDASGTIHYGKTFEEHKANKIRFLK